MYKRILVPLENSAYDDAILEHVRELAKFCGASVVLIHVADGWAARNIKQLDLRESRGDARRPRVPRAAVRDELEADGIDGGVPCSPAAIRRSEIAAAAEREKCDLIAMSTHGHSSCRTCCTAASPTRCGIHRACRCCWCAARRASRPRSA